MKRHTLKLAFLVFTALASLYLTACVGQTASDSGTVKNAAGTSLDSTFNPTGGTLRVINAVDYMDKTTIADFEREYNMRVEYTEFDSNEELYAAVSKNPQDYDILVPSDYMVDRLIKEGYLEGLNLANIPNISHVAPQYLNPAYDPNNAYVVPYMVGTFGILYNKKLVSEPVDSWSVLWDSRYSGQILMWDSMRDVLGLAFKSLGYSVNTLTDSEITEAKRRIIEQRPLVRAYAGEIIRDYMIADEAALAVVYSGEAKRAIDQNSRLVYVIPKEGSNKWVDGFVIMKGSKNKEAAELFINFMCRPNIAIRNMTATGYSSPIKGAWGEFGENAIMFPTDEELARCEAYLFSSDATIKYDKAWKEIRG